MTDHVSSQDKPGLQLAFYTHRHRIETRASDSTEANGHIPNSKIAEFADDARREMHEAIVGRDMAARLQLVEARFQYFHELTFPGDLIIGVAVTKLGNSSIGQIAGFFRDGHCHVLAHFVLVKTQDGKSTPLTADEHRRAQPFVIAGAGA